VARSQKNPADGSAGRLAAGRRPRGRDVAEKAPKTASKKASAPSGRGKKQKTSSSSAARLFKLVSLLVMMAVLGFAVVLVVDVGVTLLGNVRFGQVTFADLFAKVSDRVFDRDVPQPRPVKAVKTPAKTVAPTTTTTARSPAARAPAAAPRPEDYARHVEDRVDPEVAAARARLDQLLNRL
jgi:hypothetical protein